MLRWAVEECSGPVAIRYPRGSDRGSLDTEDIGATVTHRVGKDIAFVTYGVVAKQVMDGVQLLADAGVDAGVIRLRSLCPLPVSEIVQRLQGYRYVIVVEEVCRRSGIYEELISAIGEGLPDCKFIRRDLGENFITHGCLDKLYSYCGLDAQSLKSYTLEVIQNEN